MMIKIVLIAELPIPVVRMTPSIGFNQFLIFVDYVEPTGVGENRDWMMNTGFYLCTVKTQLERKLQ